MATANIFAGSPEELHPDRVKKLRNKVLKDVAWKVPDGEIIKYKDYGGYTSALPPLRGFPAEFRRMLEGAIFDEDMLDDLQHHSVINWCPSVKKVYPIKTTADGNCLLHAVAMYVWGLDDRNLALRRVLYVNLAMDTRDRFKQRWLFNQKSSTDFQRADVRLDTEEYGTEWDSILRATEDSTQTGNHGLPYCTLESVHLYVVANIFRRPVIIMADKLARNVFGQSLQENHIGGIYLPLEWKPSQCHKSPIILGYNMNHFAPLLMEEGVQPGGVEQAIPIVTKDLVSLVVRYLLPNEMPKCTKLLQDYLDVSEVMYTGRDGFVPIPSVKATLKLLPEKYNMIDIFRKDCEKQFRRVVDQEAGIVLEEAPTVRIGPNQIQIGRNNKSYTVVGNNVLPNQAINIVGNKTTVSVIPHEPDEDRRQCLTMGCQMFGQPEMSYLCSKCFRDFTVQYNKQEEAARKKRQKEKQAKPRPAPPRPAARGEEYHDLSMMGEDCRCGFKCSTETYPFCHECYPGNRNPQNIPPPQPVQQEPAVADLSLMPDKCHGQNCTFQCSKATYPYCHECYDKYSAIKEQPTAPPPSIPMEVDPVNPMNDPNLQLQIKSEPKKQDNVRKMDIGLNIPPSTPTTNQNTPAAIYSQGQAFDMARNKGELPKKCKTEGCGNMAVRGNDGSCDDCYNVSLFGAGNPTPSPVDEAILDHLRNLNKTSGSQQCMTPNCPEDVTFPSSNPQCLQCFLRGDIQVPAERAQATEHREPGNVAMNISLPEKMEDGKVLNSGTDEEQEKNIPPSSLEVTGPPLSATLVSQKPAPVRKADREPVVHQMNVETSWEQQGTGGSQGTYRKYICSTAGCEGIRNDNGYCLSCTKKIGTRECPEEATNISLLGGRVVTTPAGEGEEGNTLIMSCTPVVLSEEQQKELNPVITSSKQKVRCAWASCNTMIYPPKKLCDKCTAILDTQQAKDSLAENKRSVGGVGTACLTPGCKFFGTRLTENYCSSCYKSRATRHTVPLKTPKPAAQEAPNRHTAPLTPMKPTGKLCIQPGCNRYGDPAQADRCSQHYQEAMAIMPPGLSAESLQQYNDRTVTSTKPRAGQNVACVRAKSVPNNRIAMETEPSPQLDPVMAVLSKVESSRKSNQLCKNNVTQGCQNYGNSKNKGYCNTCYPIFLRLERTQNAGQNQFG